MSSDLLPIQVAYKLREALRKQTDNNILPTLTFRRIASVKCNPNDFIKNEYTTHGGSVDVKYVPEGLTPQERSKNYRQYYRRFFGYTSSKSLRPGDNDQYTGKSLYFRSKYYNELNIEDGELTFFTPAQRKKKILYPLVLPLQGEDIICGIVFPPEKNKNNKNEKNKGNKKVVEQLPEFRHWFICSDQFLRAWTMIMYDEHSSFPYSSTEPKLRRKMMSGNRLNTNSYLKWVKACEENNIEIDAKEASDRYFVLRTERTSTQYVHVYSAMVLLARYATLPSSDNVPINLGEGYVMKLWNLPEGWINTFLFRYTGFPLDDIMTLKAKNNVFKWDSGDESLEDGNIESEETDGCGSMENGSITNTDQPCTLTNDIPPELNVENVENETTPVVKPKMSWADYPDPNSDDIPEEKE